MAAQLPFGTDAGYIAAHNETHRSVVALEASKPHYDGAEFIANVEQVPDTGTPTTLALAINGANRIKALMNDHYTRHNGGNGKKIYAHKVVDNANTISAADMSAGSTYEATILTSLKTMIDELRADYIAHIASASYHAAPDVTNVLGAIPVITTYDDATEALNNLKAQYNAHIVFSSGGSPHSNPDGTNGVTAPNAVVTDLDSLVMLANQLKSKYNAHRTQATVHIANDAVNVVTGADVAFPGDLFTLANAIKSSYEAHRASTTYHESADSTNTISAANATTVTTLIALVAELYTDVTAHFRFAPVTRAVR
jgi:hypothetical protein